MLPDGGPIGRRIYMSFIPNHTLNLRSVLLESASDVDLVALK